MDTKQVQRWGIAIILTLLILNLVTLSGLWYITMFDRRPHKPPRQPRHFNDMIARSLDLSDEQQQEFTALHNAHRQVKDSLEFEIHTLSSEALDEVFAQNPDTARMNALADSVGDIHAEFEKQLLHHFLDIKAFVRPEQIANLEPLLRNLINSSTPPPPLGHQFNDRPARAGRGTSSSTDMQQQPDGATLPPNAMQTLPEGAAHPPHDMMQQTDEATHHPDEMQAMPDRGMPPPSDQRQRSGGKGHRPPPRPQGR